MVLMSYFDVTEMMDYEMMNYARYFDGIVHRMVYDELCPETKR